MTDTVKSHESVLAEMREFATRVSGMYEVGQGLGIANPLREWADRLAAAHAREVEALQTLFHESEDRCMALFADAAMLGVMKDRAEAAEADARRWQAMRALLVAVDWQPEMGGGPVVMFECKAKSVTAGPEGADAIADAAIDAHPSGGEG